MGSARFRDHCGCEVFTTFGWGYCRDCDERWDEEKLSDKEEKVTQND